MKNVHQQHGSGVRVEMRNHVGNADRNVVDCLSVREVFDRLCNVGPVDSTANDVCAVDNSDVSPVRAVSASADFDMPARELDDAGSGFWVAAVAIEGDLHRVVAVRHFRAGHGSTLLPCGGGFLTSLHAQDIPSDVRPEVFAADDTTGRALDQGATFGGHPALACFPLAEERCRDAQFFGESSLSTRLGQEVVGEVHSDIVSASLKLVNSAARIHTVSKELNNRAMRIEEVYRERLRMLSAEAGSQTALAAKLGKSPAQVSQWINASKDSKTGKPRSMDRSTAREIERKCGKPDGWMDQPIEDASFNAADFTPVRRADVAFSNGTGQVVYHEDEKPPLVFRSDFLRRLGIAPGNAVVVDAEGVSNEPKIVDGSVVLVNRGDRERLDGRFFAFRYDGELLIKRLERIDGVGVLATAENSNFKPKTKIYPASSEDQIEVIGHAVWTGATL